VLYLEALPLRSPTT